MTTPQVLASAQKDLETIISDMRTAFIDWALPTDDPDPESFSYQVGAQNAADKYAHMTDVDELRKMWASASHVERNAITARVKEIQAGEQS